ncbi:hypothetical protein [Rhodopseudomonas sp. RCAM05734]|uniref:hypothetical protein n=1 Tax=Rhodopseudomonas sp. RCAM05734 TaxID=3457549 RepID=UPI004043F155
MSGNTPELDVKVGNVTIKAKGLSAIRAIRNPIAFAIYTRHIVAVVGALALLWGGHEYAGAALRLIKVFVGG